MLYQLLPGRIILFYHSLKEANTGLIVSWKLSVLPIYYKCDVLKCCQSYSFFVAMIQVKRTWKETCLLPLYLGQLTARQRKSEFIPRLSELGDWLLWLLKSQNNSDSKATNYVEGILAWNLILLLELHDTERKIYRKLIGKFFSQLPRISVVD